MKKSLIVVDLDDTLLNAEKKISIYSKKILKKCKSAGDKIVINTARSFTRSVKFANEIDADFICSFNGNYVYDCKSGYVLRNNPIPRNASKRLIEELTNLNIAVVSEGLNASYCTSEVDTDLSEAIRISASDISCIPTYKVIVNCSAYEYHVFEKIATKYNLSISYSRNKNLIRIVPLKTDKWIGIKKIVELVGDEYEVIAFGDDSSDFLTLKNADVGVAMANSIDSIRKTINFSTSSNEDDGVAKFLSHYYNFDETSIDYCNVKLLDCSLRDGGHLNNSCFGKERIVSFIERLACANIDIIEIGFLQNSIFDENVAVYPTVSAAEDFIKDVNTGSATISLLTQVDKFDISQLEECKGKIKMIRVSFHSDLIEQGMEYCRIVKEKGYICSVNPINFSHYSNEQIVKLIKMVNKLNPDVFSIVDTFGTLLCKDFRNKVNFLNHLLNKSISLGIHLHDNLNLAFSSAQALIESNSFAGNIIIDTSVSGLGRAPGNLRTEMMAYYLNTMRNEDYYLLDHIYYLLEREIPILKNEVNWDNVFPYNMSAFEKVHRSYAEYLIENGYSFADAQKFLKLIPDVNKGRYKESIILAICEESSDQGGALYVAR